MCTTYKTPSAHSIVSALKTEYPYVYQDLITYYQPLKYDFSLLNVLYKKIKEIKQNELAENDVLGLDRSRDTDFYFQDLFFGCVVLLFTRSDAKTHSLHYGVVSYIANMLNRWLPNCTDDLNSAKSRLKQLKGFKQECEQIINQLNLKQYEIEIH